MRTMTPLMVLFAVAVLAAGCSLDYREAEIQENLSEQLPDSVLFGTTHHIVKGGTLAVVLEAERAETYSKRKQTVLTGVHFVEYSEEGTPLTEGWADQVIYHTDTQNAEIVGAYLHSVSEQVEIEAPALRWEQKPRMLTGGADELVTVQRDDGTYVAGKGFRGDFRRKAVEFSGPVEGRYVREESEDAKTD